MYNIQITITYSNKKSIKQLQEQYPNVKIKKIKQNCSEITFDYSSDIFDQKSAFHIHWILAKIFQIQQYRLCFMRQNIHGCYLYQSSHSDIIHAYVCQYGKTVLNDGFVIKSA